MLLKRTIFFALFYCVTIIAQNEVPNPSFEDWTDVDPESWNTFNANGDTINVFPSSDAYHGLISAKGEVMADNVYVGLNTGMTFPITKDYNFFVGYYKFFPEHENDSLYIGISTWNEDPNNLRLKEGRISLGGTVSGWAQFIVPITGEPGNRTTGSIEFYIANPGQAPTEGTYFLIDDLSLHEELPDTNQTEIPEISYPTDGSEDIPIDPDLIWRSVPNADKYQIQVAPNSSFDNPLIDEDVEDTTFTLECLSFNTNYYWRIRTIGAIDTSTWTNTLSFSTLSPVFNLISPLENETDISTGPVLRWHSNSGFSFYRLQLSTDPDFSTNIVDENLYDTTYQAENLNINTEYFWRINFASNCDTTEWSDTWSFTTEGTELYEIKHDSILAYGWFGGDDRPQEGPRDVGAAQSVLIDSAMIVKRFSFYFRGPFDFAANPLGSGHNVTLKLNVRDSTGTILKTLQNNLPDIFTEGWVTWDSIEVEVSANTRLIFSTYLVGAYDSIEVKASIAADGNASYPDGEYFVKEGISDADMEIWNDWSIHPFWDIAFSLEGEVIQTPTNINENNNIIPEEFVLYQNYPNPFNPTTRIKYSIPNLETRHASSLQTILKVYDILGNEITTLVNEQKAPGTYEVIFNAGNLSSGVYFYKLQYGEFSSIKKLMLMK